MQKDIKVGDIQSISKLCDVLLNSGNEFKITYIGEGIYELDLIGGV